MPNAPGTEAWKDDVLACLDSAGQHGERSQIDDRVVRAADVDACDTCGGAIVPGEWIRREIATDDGRTVSFQHCESCCDAMAMWYVEPGQLEARYALRWRRTDPPYDSAAQR